MNKERQKALAEIQGQLDALVSSLEELLAKEEVYRDNIPKELHDSNDYEKATEICELLQDALGSLEETATCIESAQE